VTWKTVSCGTSKTVGSRALVTTIGPASIGLSETIGTKSVLLMQQNQREQRRNRNCPPALLDGYSRPQ
jgi:hypothetical protein